MAIQIGQQLGSLEITALLGKGGMGEVYRARDTKLKRDVAIKILPDEFARDADRVARFQREAEVLASLSHPNIAGIYDLQHSQETQFLVMELVEGETLADRIKRGPLPVEEALQITEEGNLPPGRCWLGFNFERLDCRLFRRSGERTEWTRSGRH
jgi:serine/threonine-protein kinase